MAAQNDIISLSTKRCTKCRTEKPVTEEYFHRARRGKYRAACKDCVNQQIKQLFADNPGKRLSYARRWRERHPERYQAAIRQGVLRRKAKRIPPIKKEKNLEELRLRAQIRSQNWNVKHKGVAVRRAQEWNKAHPDRANMHRKKTKVRRRLQERDLPRTFSLEDWNFALEYWGHKCAVCGTHEGFWTHLQQDHWIPLLHKDSPGHIATNIVPLCGNLFGCNQRKSNCLPTVWLTRRFGKRQAQVIEKAIMTFFTIVRQRQEEQRQ